MQTMTHFVKHIPCTSCGSSDARALYADGGEFCFSCCAYKPAHGTVPWAVKEVEPVEVTLALPDDANYNFPPKCIEWFQQYDVNVEEIIKYGILWSEKKQQLLFSFNKISDPHTLGCIQARSFANHITRKYINQGKVDDVLPIFYAKEPSNPIVLVEDAISALKVARVYDAMPLLGSHIPYHKVLALKNSGHREVVVWLDHDKYTTAMEICEKFQLVGVKTRVICTDLDPKCYTTTTIRRHIESYK